MLGPKWRPDGVKKGRRAASPGTRQPPRDKGVTYVLGTYCYLCSQSDKRCGGGGGSWAAMGHRKHVSYCICNVEKTPDTRFTPLQFTYNLLCVVKSSGPPPPAADPPLKPPAAQYRPVALGRAYDLAESERSNKNPSGGYNGGIEIDVAARIAELERIVARGRASRAGRPAPQVKPVRKRGARQ